MAMKTFIKTPLLLYEQPLGLFIDGKWTEGIERKRFSVINPCDESVICEVCEGGAEDVDLAVKAARRALDTVWSQTSPSDRGHFLLKLANLFEQHSETLAAIESLDNGKPIALSKGDVSAAAACLRYYGGWADKLHGKTIDTDPETFNYTKHEPVGVCGQIIPWNFPLMMWAWKIGPALATGNTVVLKSAEQTPLSALYSAQLCKDVGLPAGVVNVISGFGRTAGAAIASHMNIDKVAFTGSTLVGRSILEAAAKSNLKKVSLELGGKSPNIVFNDADIQNAVSWVNFGIFFNHGQCCCAGSRIYVQSGIYDKFLEALKLRTLQNVVGDPFQENTFHGPLVSQLPYTRVMEYIQSGREEGATLETGGIRHGAEGFFIEPTIFSNTKPEMKIMREEIFGPVCSVNKFETEEEVIGYANDSAYGLAAAVHTTNLNTALRVTNAVQAGTVWVNNYNMLSPQIPFGGFKESGMGRELGKYALANYTQIKSVRIRLGGALFG